jgi:hypothetical protein
VCTLDLFHPLGYQKHAFASLLCDFRRQPCGVWVGPGIFRRGGGTQFLQLLRLNSKYTQQESNVAAIFVCKRQNNKHHHIQLLPSSRHVVRSVPSSTRAPTLATAQPYATLFAATATRAARPLLEAHHESTTECTMNSSRILPATVNLQ